MELHGLMHLSFSQQRVVISGGGSGIGRATALAFARAGAQVHIVGRDEANLAATVALAPEQIHAQRCDLDDTAAWIDYLRSVGPLDILVNNAALSRPVAVEECETAAWEQLWRVNFQAALVGSREAARQMRATGRGGRIVNVSSIQGQRCEYGNHAYGIAKAAMEGLTRSLAVELAKEKILVNAVAPGFVDTPMSSASGVNELETDWFKTHYIENGRLPLRRAGRAEEIATAILFLAHPDNSYTTGVTLCVDGGLTLTL